MTHVKTRLGLALPKQIGIFFFIGVVDQRAVWLCCDVPAIAEWRVRAGELTRVVEIDGYIGCFFGIEVDDALEISEQTEI